jgi:hypothetical protein
VTLHYAMIGTTTETSTNPDGWCDLVVVSDVPDGNDAPTVVLGPFVLNVRIDDPDRAAKVGAHAVAILARCDWVVVTGWNPTADDYGVMAAAEPTAVGR